MIYNFDTSEKRYAVAALLLYATYRSRDKSKFKVSPEMWGQIQRFTQAAAKRAKTLQQFINNLQPKMNCPSLNPKWLEIGIQGRTFLQSGSNFIELSQPERRNFLTEVLREVDDKEVIKLLRNETQFIILLVRDRLEKEKSIENTFNIEDETL